jgi:hypothetical protein
MPPRPSNPMIRYRSSTTTPGVKRPWSIDPDEVSQPLVVILGWLEGVGPDASFVWSLPRTVSASDGWICAPQEAQNLAPAGTEALHEGQVTARS